MKSVLFYSTLLILLVPAWQACNSADPSIIPEENKFNLEGVGFKEAIPGLYAKHIVVEEGIRYDSARDGKLTDSMLQYRISNSITDAMRLSVPQKDFGYLYRSPQIDSLARFGEIYFHKLATLTGKDKKPVAYYAETELASSKERKRLLTEFIKKYGNPTYSFQISHEFNHRSYEWQLPDRTIQIETSKGVSASFGGNDTAMKQSYYYTLDMLIIANPFKKAVHDAHIYEFPEKILYDGKWHSYKDFQFEKKQVFRDDFLLNSTYENYIKNEYGEYSISEEEEE